ncbi:MAG: NADP-dependent malic enzyme [Alphaproteobacteria bacterium]|nr:NADP-dependent malic enzyme [Alphaproteobacteria bacterium]MDD9920370.1 NADP-dependent malic enzyme [Alphaproteobacteria bacterium]
MPDKEKSKLYEDAIEYHSHPKPGKIEVVSTKPLVTQADLSLGYTPGVAEVCMEIKDDPEQANNLTAKANLVAVITNGTAVLGLGDIGPLASKPVMEGKSVLFKKFANIDVFDLEVDEKDPDKFVETVARLAPTFGGINLEDIKAPECFEIEQKLRDRLDIPVLHDDQHGTAIIACSALINALHVADKQKEDVKIVCCGAGAAGLACMNLFVDYGVPRDNITLVDIEGVIHAGRKNLNEHLKPFAHKTKARTLTDALDGADVFFGLSAGGILKPQMVKNMAEKPIIFAMANPEPEIRPDVAKNARPDAIVGTGRSDFPNQINNVLGFPYLFRGALDCGAKIFNKEMKLAAAESLAKLARKEADASLSTAYKGKRLRFGPDYLIPKPFDPRLLATIAPAVAKAAMDTGAATRPIEDLDAYKHSLRATVDQSFTLMRQIFSSARKKPKRVVYPEGEDPRILQAVQSVVNDGLALPIVLGRHDIVRPLIQDLGLSMKEGEDFTLVDPQTDDRLEEYTDAYYDLRKREGVTRQEAGVHLRGRWMIFGSMMIRSGDADALVCGLAARFNRYLGVANSIINNKHGTENLYALQLVMHKDRVFCLADTHVNVDPTAEQIAEMTSLAVKEMQHFGLDPKVALLSHSNFGASKKPEAEKMREARCLIRHQWPDIQVEGEMQADCAMNNELLQRVFPDSSLQEPANLLIFPSLDAANISFNIMRMMNSSAEYIGPILMGMEKPVHILSVDAPVRHIVNMTALAVVQAQSSS